MTKKERDYIEDALYQLEGDILSSPDSDILTSLGLVSKSIDTILGHPHSYFEQIGLREMLNDFHYAQITFVRTGEVRELHASLDRAYATIADLTAD